MDGNGRWAEKKGLIRMEGHRAGLESVRVAINSCLIHKVPILTLFAFSSENWLRPDAEVQFLMSLLVDALSKQIEELHSNNIRVRFIGDRNILSHELQTVMHQAETYTVANHALTLNLAINYGGRWDILQATQQCCLDSQQGHIDPNQLDEEMFSNYLSTGSLPDPDLLIRTSGESRISNFLLWQLAYTEIYFTEIYWPDFTPQEFEKSLQSFTTRERRYGKTSQQVGEII